VLCDRTAEVTLWLSHSLALGGKPKSIGDEKRKARKKQERPKSLNRALRSGVKPLAVLTLPLLTQFQYVTNYTLVGQPQNNENRLSQNETTGVYRPLTGAASFCIVAQ